MRFYADLHIHSKYSRATSRDCDLEHLAWWARRKGLTVVATGDFTHPAWWQEIRDKLVPAEPGLFRLRPDVERAALATLPPACRGPVRFMLEVEISTIYKLGDKTRKIHHLVYAANLETAGRFRDALGKIGNIKSDGRPILGLDSRHLLEITLESGDDAYLVPAHVWTPWFAVLGSKSGFDSVTECYGDLADHIFAVETGLSSDPPMNWRVSQLDRYTLVSNSDAHSPPKLGREANVFDTELDYFAMRQALETGAGFSGTLEFFPEEGKYHLDGHRACGVRLEPEATRSADGRCPSCGKPVTVGVLHRVETLADRPVGGKPDETLPFRSLVPLPEIVGELHSVGAKSKTVERTMASLVSRLGPELEILQATPLEDVERTAGTLMAEAVRRLRAGHVRAEGGYDGEYGVIRLFEPGEVSSQISLFAPQSPHPQPLSPDNQPGTVEETCRGRGEPEGGAEQASPAEPQGQGQLFLPQPFNPILDALDSDQRAAAETVDGPLLILAGPGTGKTRTLTHRLAHLVACGADPRSCLALTFTRRAAEEMRERLAVLTPDASRMVVTTFHGLGLRILRERHADIGLHRGFRVADDVARLHVACGRFGLSKNEGVRVLAEIDAARRRFDPVGKQDEQVVAYREALLERDLVDFDDLLLRPLELLDEDDNLAAAVYRERFRHVSIDEYQDVDAVQYRLLRQLVAPGGNVCAIGDPDQSIYSFRGADVGFFLRFREDFPAAREVHLGRNYRSQPVIVRAALQAIAPSTFVPGRRLAASGEERRIVVAEAPSEAVEAELIVKTIEEMVGGTSHFSLDSGRVDSGDAPAADDLSFDDFAVLYRTNAQAASIVEALERSGIPFQKRSHERLMVREDVRLVHHTLEGMTVSATEAREPRAIGEWLEVTRDKIGTTLEASRFDAVVDLLKPLAERHGDDVRTFLTELALGAEVDTWDPRAERVSLLTLHAAKGLEFRAVFMVGCEAGLLPLSWGKSEDVDVDEERRLFFVGLTRAKEFLFLSRAKRRAWRGERRETKLSPFLQAVAADLLEKRQIRLPRRRRAVDDRQLRLL